MKTLWYPLTTVGELECERDTFLNHRRLVESCFIPWADKKRSLARIDRDLAYNAALIRQAELKALGHLATDGAWLQ